MDIVSHQVQLVTDLHIFAASKKKERKKESKQGTPPGVG